MKMRLLILAAFVVLSVPYCFATPIFEKNDEESHAWFAHLLATGGGLPIQNPDKPGAPLEREGSQPPLYYWLAAAVMSRFDLSDFDYQQQPNASPQFNPYAPNNKNLLVITPQKRPFGYEKTTLAAVVLRLLGILPGAATVWLVYGIAAAATGDRRAALLAMGLTAFNPMFIQVMTALGNDGPVIALSTAALYALMRIATAGPTAPRVAAAGIAIGLAGLTKVSGTLLLPVAAVAILGRELLAPSSRSTARRAMVVLAAGAGVALLWAAIAGWWHWRNLQLYGDLTGTSVMARMMTPRDFTLLEALGEFQGFRMSYIAMFGQFAVPADGLVYIAFDVLLALSGLGLAAWLARAWRGRAAGTPEQRGQARLRGLAIGLLALHAAVLLASVIRWTMMTPASHGRLIYPGIAGVSTLMALGLMQIASLAGAVLARSRAAGRGGQVVAAAVLAPMALLSAVAPFRYILPAYAPPLVSEAPGDLLPAGQRMGDLAEVAAYRMTPAEARPGEKVRVQTALRALRSERDNYSLSVKLYGRDGAFLARFDTFTGKGLWPSSLWRPGDLFLDEVELTVPPTATAPSILRAQFELYNAGSGHIAPSVDADGRPGAPLYDGATLLPFENEAAPVAGRAAAFGDLASLLAFTASAPLRGQALELELRWRAEGRGERDYTVFAHLEGADGRVVAQHDKPPLDGQFPTSRWAAGAAFDDRHQLAVPADLAPGAYRLTVGLYDPATGQRLPAAAGAAGGVRVADGNTLILAEFAVE